MSAVNTLISNVYIMYKSYLAFISLVFVLLALNPKAGYSQDESIERLAQRIDSLREAKSVFKFGLSVGPRVVAFEKSSILEKRSASISPADSTLQLKASIVLK